MSNIKRFSSRKEVTEFLKGKGIDTSTWSEEKWLQFNKGQAEIHMMALAECIWDAVNESTPRQLKAGEWHIPFESKIGEITVIPIGSNKPNYKQVLQGTQVMVSVAMAARTSYTVVGEEKALDYEAMIDLHDRLLAQDPPHSSPLEHCAKAMTNEEYSFYVKGKGEWWEHPFDSSLDLFVTNKNIQGWCNNFKGFIPYRYMVDNGKVD